jgi:hypothetical protein
MFEQYSDINSLETPPAVSPAVPWYRRTDRHDQANCRFPQFDAANKEYFAARFSQANNKSRNFRETSPVISRCQTDKRQAKQYNHRNSLRTVLGEKIN